MARKSEIVPTVLTGSEHYIGLAPGALTIRNSVRKRGACPHRWLKGEGYGLRTIARSRALTYGDAWHHVMEEVHRWWLKSGGEPFPHGEHCKLCDGAGCGFCQETGLGSIERITEAWEELEDEKLAKDAAILRANFEGWFYALGREHGPSESNTSRRIPPDGWQVVAVELPIAMPIMRPSNRSMYRVWCYVTKDRHGNWRRARAEEVENPPPNCEVHYVKVPVYMTSILDLVWANPERGVLRVGEHKSSSTPRDYLAKLSADPQVPTYNLVLQHVVSKGLLEGGHLDCLPIPKDWRVSGFFYTVASSHGIRGPELLKDGNPSLNRSKLKSTPSWLFGRACKEAGLDLTDPANRKYLDMVRELRDAVDNKRFRFEEGSIPPRLLVRTARENYALAAAEATRWRKAAKLRGLYDPEADYEFPRVPVCRSEFGTCPFLSLCEMDDGHTTRSMYEVDEPLDTSAEEQPKRAWGAW